MNVVNSVGFFGKLPAHGDFIYRHLPSHFINAWDTWLQGFVGSTQEQLGEAWLDIYLTSPIWRFVFSDGVVDGNAWAGIMLPSVDRVGRYFPFSIATILPSTANPFLIIDQLAWFDAIEQAALKALDGQLQVEDLIVEINQHRLNSLSPYKLVEPTHDHRDLFIELEEDASPSITLPFLMNSACKDKLNSYSVWSTTYGSQRVPPSLFYTQGLPQLRGVAAMLDGQWSLKGWAQPYALEQKNNQA